MPLVVVLHMYRKRAASCFSSGGERDYSKSILAFSDRASQQVEESFLLTTYWFESTQSSR